MHNSTLTPTIEQPGQLIAGITNISNHSSLQPPQNKNKNKRNRNQFAICNRNQFAGAQGPLRLTMHKSCPLSSSKVNQKQHKQNGSSSQQGRKHRDHYHTGKVLHYTLREPPTGTTTSKLIVTRTQDTLPPGTVWQ